MTSGQLFRAFLDSGTHFLVGALTWLVIDPRSLDSWDSSKRVLAVATLSSLIDIDHFIAARSFRLSNALTAPYRGIFHCSGLLLTVNLILFSNCCSTTTGLCFLAAWLPHHIRDATRRGFYLFPPQVHTAPLRYDIATILTVSFPWLVSLLKMRLSPLNQPVRAVFNV